MISIRNVICLVVLVAPLPFQSAANAKQPEKPDPATSPQSVDALGTKQAAATRTDADQLPDRNWPMFRGNPLGTGRSLTKLPDKLELIWNYKVPDGAFEGTAAIVDGSVFIGDLDGTVHALDLANGKKKWTYKVESGFAGSPSVRNGRIFIGDYDGVFYCLDINGKLLWKYEAEAEINSGANFYGGNVLFGSQDATLYCLDQATGKLVWKYQIEDQIRCLPTVVADRCFVAGCDARLHIIDLKQGKGAAAVDIDGPTMVTPAVVGDSTCFGTEQGTAYSVNWKKARVNWQVEIDERGDSIRSSPAITKIGNDSVMIFGTRSKHIYAVRLADGKKAWEYKTRSMVDSSPVVCGDRVFFGTDRGKLIALDVNTGKVNWETDLGGTITASPAIADGRLIISNDRGTVFCFGQKQ